jgi:hypothetical protein
VTDPSTGQVSAVTRDLARYKPSFVVIKVVATRTDGIVGTRNVALTIGEYGQNSSNRLYGIGATATTGKSG